MDTLDLLKTFRDIAELERRLGVHLLNRSTRSVSLTDAGALLLKRSAPMLELLDFLETRPGDKPRAPR